MESIYCDYGGCKNIAKYQTELYCKNKKRSAKYCEKHLKAIKKKLPELKETKIKSVPLSLRKMILGFRTMKNVSFTIKSKSGGTK